MRPSIKPELILMTGYKPQAKIVKTLTLLTLEGTSGRCYDKASVIHPALLTFPSMASLKEAKNRIPTMLWIQASHRWHCIADQSVYRITGFKLE